MKHLITYLIFCLICSGGFAQQNLTKVEKSNFLDADFFFYQGRYTEAYDILSELYKKHRSSCDIAYRLAVCEVELEIEDETTKSKLDNALKCGNTEAKFHLGRYHHLNHDFDLAISFFEDYKTFSRKEQSTERVVYEINACEQAKLLISEPQDVLVVNMGAEINSPFDEYIPVISSDESVMYFTSRRDDSTGGKKDLENNFFEDIYKVEHTEDGWSKPINELGSLNSKSHDATAAISSDGNNMVIYRTNKKLTGGDLYITSKKNDSWDEPQLLDANINSAFQEASACFSPDNETLYFSSNRPGGFGGRDIYRVKKLPNGEWSYPKNLGPTINTEYDEDSPFMDIDNRTLYFSSEGHNTMGGFDIFSSKRKGIETWDEPENLGYPANTVNDDIYLSITPGGRKGYYSSEHEDGYGKQDLYEINFIYRQNINLIVKGTLLDDKGAPIQGEISLINEDTKELFGIYTSNNETGKFILVLNPLVKYKVVIESEGKTSQMDTYYFEYPEEQNTELNLEPIVLK